MVSRRAFIGGAASLGALSGCRLFRAPTGLFAGAGAKLTLGIVSDIHVDCGRGDFRKFGDASQFERTLRWFDAQGVDGVIVAGDLADNGMVNQLECVAEAWFRVFPSGRSARDGRPVEQLFVYGNHDYEGHGYDHFSDRYFDRDSFCAARISEDPKGVWESLFHEEYAPIWHKRVKGYSIVGAHWKFGEHSWHGIPAVEDWFAANGKSLDPALPFFFVQHPHPKGTVYGDDAWSPDRGFATRALTPFPNAVAFSGHSHDSLTDERSIWQGAFTSVATASLRYGGRVDKYEQRQGLLMRVYDDHLTLVRRDFLHDASLGDDWVVPLPAAEPKPFSFPSRAAKSTPPAFAPGARLAVRELVRKESAGTAKDEARGAEAAEREIRCWEVTIPCANAGVTRAFRYELATGLAGPDGKEVKFLRYDAKYNMPLSRAGAETKYLVKETEFAPAPGGAALKPVFTVVPLDSFGNRGEAIGT